MYQVDDRDKVVEMKDLPQSDAGAPLPLVFSNEHTVVLAYYLNHTPPDWDGTTIQVVGYETQDLPIALVCFKLYDAFMFGPPNDEAFSGHPLASRGLHPYSCFEIVDSSWIRGLERMNSVHPYHRPERYAALKHFVFAFHDSTFECVADGFTLSLHRGSLSSVIPKMLELLNIE